MIEKYMGGKTPAEKKFLTQQYFIQKGIPLKYSQLGKYQ